MRKILVLRGGALGDFIVTLPALFLLRERWPDAQIELAGNATAAQLARARGWLDAVHSQHESRWGGLYGDGELSPEFARWLAEFDLVISYWPDPDGVLGRHFPRRTDQIFLTAPAMPSRAPAAAHYRALLENLGLRSPRNFVSLAPLDKRVSAPTIVIHPGSGSPRKNWSKENWLKFFAGLRGPASLILGEAEMEHWGSFRSSGFTSLIQLPLEELVSHLARCRLFVGHDSGVSHLAAACGARCLLLFGPTDPTMWAPPSSTVHVLQADSDLAALSVEAVERAVAAALAGPA